MHDSDPDPLVRRARARVRQVLRGKWRLDALLGVGGMASVYAATHRNGKRGAVKMLHPELCSDEEARSRFLREGYVANRVDHAGAVSVLDDDTTDDGGVFLVMELLEGETLDARAERAGGRLPLVEVIAMAAELLDVLAAAHDKGIVHRDLKPENLFLPTGGQLKVLDFGIARLREMSSASQATRTGSLLGTPAFMAPEQALGNWSSVDGRTDLWAVGATMFCLLTGETVHDADTVNKLLLAAMTKPARPIGSVRPALPASLCAVIDRALAFDIDQRWPDARSMKNALMAPTTDARTMATHEPSWQGAAAAEPSVARSVALTRTTGPVTTPTSYPLPSKRRGAVAAIAAAVATTIAIGAAALVWLAPSTTRDGPPAAAEGSSSAPAAEIAPQGAELPPQAPTASAPPTAAPEPTAIATAAPAEAAPEVTTARPRAPAPAARTSSTTAKPVAPKKTADPLDRF